MDFDPSSDEGLIFIVFFYGGLCVVGLAIQAFICWLVARCYTAIPSKHRMMEPNMVWLNMIPLFNLVWNFYVYLRLSDSFLAYFREKGDSSVGDCGRNMGKWFSICMACSVIPCVGSITGLVGLVLLILYLVKASELRSRILAEDTEDEGWSQA